MDALNFVDKIENWWKKSKIAIIGGCWSLIPLLGEFFARGYYLNYTLDQPWMFATGIIPPINFFIHMLNWKKKFPKEGKGSDPFDDMMIVVLFFPTILRLLFEISKIDFVDNEKYL